MYNPLNAALTPSQVVLALIKKFEKGPNGGFAPCPYVCPAGKTTVGWGHVIRDGGRFVHPLSINAYPLSAEAAEELLQRDLQRICGLVLSVVCVPLTQYQFDALVCFTFNVGYGNFSGSTLLQKLNVGDTAGAADEFLRWNKATDPKTGVKVILPGLTRRRQAERDLFLRDDQQED